MVKNVQLMAHQPSKAKTLVLAKNAKKQFTKEIHYKNLQSR